jgi:hypothetical protein
LLAAISIQNADDAGQPILKSAGWCCFTLLIGCFLYSFHVNYFRNWKAETGVHEVSSLLNSSERGLVPAAF